MYLNCKYIPETIQTYCTCTIIVFYENLYFRYKINEIINNQILGAFFIGLKRFVCGFTLRVQGCRQQQYALDLADKSRRGSAPRAHDLVEVSPPRIVSPLTRDAKEKVSITIDGKVIPVNPTP